MVPFVAASGKAVWQKTTSRQRFVDKILCGAVQFARRMTALPTGPICPLAPFMG
jgi:hypothetical protein